jgi:hypothetical protein
MVDATTYNFVLDGKKKNKIKSGGARSRARVLDGFKIKSGGARSRSRVMAPTSLPPAFFFYDDRRFN